MSQSTVPAPSPVGDVDDIVALLAVGHLGADDPARPMAERVDLLSHALQCADRLAERFPDDTELHVAGLLHDLGHHIPLAGLRDRQADHELAHGREGARLVRSRLGERVASLIELHVPAKRYLVTFDPSYAGVLSSVSTFTLERQGGLMTANEANAFRSHPEFDAAIALRRADDDAKEPGRAVSSLASWKSVLSALAARQETARTEADR